MAAPAIARESTNDAARIQFINNKSVSVKRYALDSRKAGTVLGAADPVARGRLEDTDALLSWLDTSVDMNPELKSKTNLLKLLELIYKEPKIHFSENTRSKAKALVDRWSAENWGAPAAPEPQIGGGSDTGEGINDNALEEDVSGPSINRRPSTIRSGSTRIHYPPPAHAIWGQNGIFHGLAKKENLDTGTISTVLNDRLTSQKKDPKIYGHNGLKVGQWFPSQLSALVNGAVGASQAGISGHTANGAYSIVVSGAYDDLDTDNGDVLYYSGSNSHSNTDPKNPLPSTTGTKCLKASFHTHKPVRVMRAAGGRGGFSPPCGIRYDGLYTVVSMNRPINKLGGRYEQFRLVRLDDPRFGNGSLEECKLRPNPKEVRDHGEKDVRYW